MLKTDKLSFETMTSEEIKIEMKGLENLYNSMNYKLMEMLDEMDSINNDYIKGEIELNKRGVI